MPGILELDRIDERVGIDTWLMRLPDDICDREGLAYGTLVSMTVKDHGIHTRFITPPSKKLQEISTRLLEKDREVHRMLKDFGD